jgi:hypothetical protein
MPSETRRPAGGYHAARGTDSNHLHACLSEFPEICRNMYGVTFDLEAMEEKVRRLRRRDRPPLMGCSTMRRILVH